MSPCSHHVTMLSSCHHVVITTTAIFTNGRRVWIILIIIVVVITISILFLIRIYNLITEFYRIQHLQILLGAVLFFFAPPAPSLSPSPTPSPSPSPSSSSSSSASSTSSQSKVGYPGAQESRTATCSWGGGDGQQVGSGLFFKLNLFSSVWLCPNWFF